MSIPTSPRGVMGSWGGGGCWRIREMFAGTACCDRVGDVGEYQDRLMLLIVLHMLSDGWRSG